MDLSLLKYIVTIAEVKKLSLASEKLHITSSALSQSIKKLESELGVPIFEKVNGHSFQLTDAGRIYVEGARKMLKIKESVYRELEDVQHDNRGRFIFGCSPKRGLAMLSNIYPKFYKKYPKIRIDLKEANLNTLYDAVVSGHADIAVLTPLSEEHKSVTLEPLDTEEIVLAVPPDHLLASEEPQEKMGTIKISDLHLFKEDNWMMTNNSSMLRDLTDTIFRQAGFFPERVLLETSSTHPHISAVEEGIAVSLVPMPRRLSERNMKIFHLEPRQHRRLYAAYRKNYLLSNSQRYFIDLMAEFYTDAADKALPPHRMGW